MATAEEEAEFESLFGARYAAKAKVEDRMKAERRASLTDNQRTRGGAKRSENMNFRCSAAFKIQSFGLSKFMGAASGKKVSVADMLEEAVALLAKKKGYRDESNA